MASQNVEFEQRVACPLHDGPHRPLTLLGTLPDKLTGRSFTILRCSDCGVGLTDPYPTPGTVGALYGGRESVGNFDPIRGTVVDRLKDGAARRDLRSMGLRAGERVLDFGTGNGRFAAIAVAMGAQADAVDFTATGPDLPAGARYLDVEQFWAGSDLYDLVLLRHVLEHMHDPIRFLARLASRLRPGGRIYVEVPNRVSAHIRFFGRRANGYQVPYHLFHFDAPSLARVVEAAGLSGAPRQKEMPLAGGILAAMLGQQRGLRHQLAGIALEPLQLALDAAYGRPCLAVLALRGDAIP